MIYGEDAESTVQGWDRPYELVQGVAVIPICGTLVQKSSWMDAYSGVCGYNEIRVAFLTALRDHDAQAILLDVDSPGGEIAGCFDLVDTIYAARGQKPIWSILNEVALSAGYALASAPDRVIVPRTGGCGSVGVICMHTDLSKAFSKDGIKVTLLTYGTSKADFLRSSRCPSPLERVCKPISTQWASSSWRRSLVIVEEVPRPCAALKAPATLVPTRSPSVSPMPCSPRTLLSQKC